jgi:putative hydrolase of the HAD superfamily
MSAHPPAPRRTAAVFFDVDFTLIYPGPTFQGEGYRRFCAKHGITVDQGRFGQAVRAASVILDAQQQHVYDAEIFVRYTQRIIEEMGGTGPALTACASEIYDEWAACHHFHLYDDVEPVLRELARRDVKIGLISNSHRSLASFEQHFELEGLISAAVSSSEHGYLKPHPSIFEAALRLAEVRPEESVMVGDSFSHDIEGARSVGMRGVLVHRGAGRAEGGGGIPVIRDLAELLPLI